MRILFFYIGYYLFLLWYGVNFLSFSFVEAKSIEKFWPLKYILNFSFFLFGKNDFALRFPEIFFSFFSLMLFYNISSFYLKKNKDLIMSVVIFSLIPGFIISSLIVNKSVYLLFLTLLFIYSYFKNRKLSFYLLGVYTMVDYSFISLYFSLIFYSIYKKDKTLLIASLIFMAVNANMFNYRIGGVPHGYFLNVFGTYFLIFSPLVFVYFIYTIYKGFFQKKDVIFFISALTFLLSIFLSFRQRIKIDDYAPFVLPYTVIMVKIFLSSYRVRLPSLRKGYKILFSVLFVSLLCFDAVLFLNRYTPARNLTSSFYFVKPLVKILKQNKINYLKCNTPYFQTVLNFYGFKGGKKYFLYYDKKEKKVSIFHNNKLFKTIDVSKLNTL
jgi:hypothetical protein